MVNLFSQMMIAVLFLNKKKNLKKKIEESDCFNVINFTNVFLRVATVGIVLLKKIPFSLVIFEVK